MIFQSNPNMGVYVMDTFELETNGKSIYEVIISLQDKYLICFVNHSSKILGVYQLNDKDELVLDDIKMDNELYYVLLEYFKVQLA